MERTNGPQTPYEVYCYNCNTSFAVGTRICVHCGHRIGSAPPGPGGGPIPDLIHAEGEEQEAGESLAKRFASMAVWVVIVLGATLMRLCNTNGE